MNNLYGITNIRIKQFICHPSDDDRSMREISEFLDDYDGDIIDIQYVGQSLGQVIVFITYRR